MTTKGRPRKDEDTRTGHRKAVGQGDAIEVAPVEERLVGADPPEDLAPLAAEVWKICVADMTRLGHLREPDLIQIRNYSVEVAIAIETEATIAEFGAMMKEPITAWSDELQAMEMVGWKLKRNPACKEHREASMAARLLGTELGLTTMARIRGNLMAAATASIAVGIRDALESDLEAEDIAFAEAAKPKTVACSCGKEFPDAKRLSSHIARCKTGTHKRARR